MRENVLASLDIMWKGMLGLFLVCGAVAVVMIGVSKVITMFSRPTGAEPPGEG